MVRLKLENSSGGIVFLCLTYFYKNRENDCYFQDTYDILKKSRVKGVIHCFSGNIENAKMYISLGFKLGIGGVLTFKNSKLKDVLKELELSNIVTETDSPYLTPEPYRGKINEPKYVKEIISRISEIKEMDIESVEKIIEQNVKDTFGI